ncbi:hypothetical protein [Nocardia farcinica]|uniref:hypothetical protein n=1 Tax=Nocardia farcinica TaxID=37329 RepID=UPI00245778BF|nr:hypothetical protein [Nocardia farcinica]
MRYVIDLDRAAEEISRRRPGWVARGLIVSATTWRDGAVGWPQPIETDRAQVGDPDSVGVRLSRPPDFELEVILYRGG